MTRRYARRDGEKRMNKQQLLVVGNGMVGHHFIEQLVNAGGLDTFVRFYINLDLLLFLNQNLK